MPPDSEISFRPVEVADFPTLTAWLNTPHVRRFYQPEAITLAEVAEEYGPAVRGEEPSFSHLALTGGAPFGYVQSYRNVDYPEWAEIIGVDHGTSVDLYLGEPAFLRRGYGQAMLRQYLRQVVFPKWPKESRVYIAHETSNTTALACSRAAGFRPIGSFLENGAEAQLLMAERLI